MVLRSSVQIIFFVVSCVVLVACSTIAPQQKPSLIPAKKTSIKNKQTVKPLDFFKSTAPSQTQNKEMPNENKDDHEDAIDGSIISILLSKAIKAQNAQQWLRAQRSLEQAIRIEPNNPAVFFQYGKLYQEMGAIDKAKSMYKRALFLADKNDKIKREIEDIFSPLQD